MNFKRSEDRVVIHGIRDVNIEAKSTALNIGMCGVNRKENTQLRCLRLEIRKQLRTCVDVNMHNPFVIMRQRNTSQINTVHSCMRSFM